jgi:hypothetical protein
MGMYVAGEWRGGRKQEIRNPWAALRPAFPHSSGRGQLGRDPHRTARELTTWTSPIAPEAL